MRVDFLGLQAFLTIAERRSFQRAAAHLNLSQTALSHRMRKLEDDLCVKLLVRTGREVTLTREGCDLLPKARKSLEDIEASLRELRTQGSSRQTRLAIGCLPTVAVTHLPLILKDFRASQHGAVVRAHDNSASEMAELLQSGAIEFAVTVAAASSPDVEIEALARESFVLICPRDHQLAGATAVDWSELTGLPLVRVSRETANRALIDDALGSRRELLDWRYEVQRTATAVNLVRAGLGLTILPMLAMQPSAMPGLVAVPLRNPGITRTLGLLSRKDVLLSPLAETLRACVRRYFRDLSVMAATEHGPRIVRCSKFTAPVKQVI
jgi:DNA-binding transcriptional LysR family regulator